MYYSDSFDLFPVIEYFVRGLCDDASRCGMSGDECRLGDIFAVLPRDGVGGIVGLVRYYALGYALLTIQILRFLTIKKGYRFI